MSNTRTAIRQELGRLLHSHELVSTADTNATAANVVLRDYKSTLLQDGLFVGWFIYVSYDAGGAHGAPEGEWGRVYTYTANTGTFVLDHDLTAAVTLDDQVELWQVIHPKVSHTCIDRALRKMYYSTLAVPSLMADADMESSGTSYWTASGASIAKNTDTTAGNVWRGLQSLSVTDSGGGNGYAKQQFKVMGGDAYYVWAACRNSAAATQCKLESYDATNNVEIESETSNEQAWGGLGFSFTIPDTCELLDIRLITVTASGVSYWDHVGLYQQGARRYALPNWVTEIGQVGRTIYRVQGPEFQADVGALDVTAGKRWESIHPYKEGATVYIVPDPPFNHIGPIYVRCIRPYAALLTDASATDADLDWVVAKAKYECLRLLDQPGIPAEDRKEFERKLNEAKFEAAAWDRAKQPKIDYAWGFGGETLWSP